MEHEIEAIIALTFKTRLAGLLRPLPYLLYLPKCHAIHTFGMKEPIHLIWLSKEARIIDKDLNVKPWRVRICLKADSVVEFLSARYPISALECYKIGDRFKIHPLTFSP